MLRSLRNRLALVFFAVTFVAIAALYLYVAPGLRNRLLDEKLKVLAATASTYSHSIAVGTDVPRATVERQVDTAALKSGARVSLLDVNTANGQPQLSTPVVDSNPGTDEAMTFPLRRWDRTAAGAGRRLPGRALADLAR
ncbi:MAG: hypothetical protein E6G05_06570 [Actinobacteria bacterium]|nr:MAG: hypothetical protein E6G05_06570 [Actinomycetota bacterium]